MSHLLITMFAYLINKFFGEFTFIKHPVINIGEMITSFEEDYYKDSILRGFLLVMFVLSVVSFISVVIMLFLDELPLFIDIIVTSVISSIFIAHKMLYDSNKNIFTCSNTYKAAIETYAENLSDGVVAPLFYLLLFGLPGIVIYKAVNTMDSMVGYRTKKYEKYGKVAAILDNILNYIPSRITAVFIMLRGKIQRDNRS